MLTTKPRLRIKGQGTRLRVRTGGNWNDDAAAALRESCRASTAVDKAVAEAIGRARVNGMSWTEIGATLGVAEAAENEDNLLDAWATSRRLVLQHQLRGLTD